MWHFKYVILSALTPPAPNMHFKLFVALVGYYVQDGCLGWKMGSNVDLLLLSPSPQEMNALCMLFPYLLSLLPVFSWSIHMLSSVRVRTCVLLVCSPFQFRLVAPERLTCNGFF